MKVIEKSVLIKVDPIEEKTKSGIIIPQDLQTKKNIGEIIAKGELAKEVEIGNKILFPINVGVEVNIEEEKYLLLQQSQILVIL